MTACTLFGRAGTRIALSGVLALILAGCGGGGGGGTPAPVVGRSYNFSANGQTLAMSVDAAGRFTIYARDETSLPGGAGAQGTLGASAFTAVSSDGTVQFTGTVASGGSSAGGTVRLNGQTLFSFTAPTTATRATPGSLAGTYSGTAGANRVLLTIDSATSHATLYAKLDAVTGGGLLAVGDNGALQSADGATVAQLSPSGSTYTLQITRLNGQNVSAQISLARQSQAKWTFMVFLNAANDLQEFAALNVNQMEKIGSSSNVNIVIQWKQANCGDCGQPDWVGTRRYYIRKDTDSLNVTSPVLEDMGTGVDMGDWRELRNFIVWTQQRYPADHYAVVLWNHGAGWRQTRAGDRLKPAPRSVSIDNETGHEIQTWQLPQGLDVTPKMDMVVFDASLMQMIEVAYEIRNSTPIVVGSEESPPGEGYVYDGFLADLAANPNLTPTQFATQIVNRTLQAYGTDGDNTQSALDTTKLQVVADRLDAFANLLQAHIGDSREAMRQARNSAESYKYAENKDLWDYAERIKTGTGATDLKNAATALQQVLSQAIFAEKHGALNAGSHGLAVYVPDPSQYDPRYANLALARVTNWDVWLQNQP